MRIPPEEQRMETRIGEGTYKGFPCVDMENEYLIVKVIPLSGGKIQSIFDKRTRSEVLYQSDHGRFRQPDYGMSFDESDLSGFDDMFPTILPCCYPDSPWQGVCLPDHGEVWSLPWAYGVPGDALMLSCHGVKLPYELEKTIAFTKQNTVSISYRARNRSPFPMKFIWAAHPLVNIDESSEVLLPAETERIFHTYDGADKPNAFGRIGNWEEEKKRYGTIEDPAEERCGKFYVLGKLQTGDSAIYSSRTKQYVKFSVPVKQVPYLGVWVNWNGYAIRQKNMALEPCTGAPDAIDAAGSYGWISEISPNGTYEWNLEIETGFAQSREAVGI
jgi:galactose mutarotase-like enzyme